MDEKLPNTTITAAQAITGGSFTAPGSTNQMSNLPPFCRVAATLTPSTDSDIKIEVWLPASGWNGKFQAIGNGGWTGSIPYPAMAAALAEGIGLDVGGDAERKALAARPVVILALGERHVVVARVLRNQR